jgi:hypothetical protein
MALWAGAGQTDVVVEPREPESSGPTGYWRALRQDPLHAAEVAILYSLPQLTPLVKMWWAKTTRTRPSESPDQVAKRVLRRSTSVARRAGLITGSSFYVGWPPAMAMIYCEQLTVVLRIAAAYGRDPSSPARAAEVLVVQGRYETVVDATEALQKAGAAAPSPRSAGDVRTVAEALRQLPSMIGLHVRKFTTRSPIDMIITGVEVASFFVPIVSLPVWAIANARATRRLGRAAIDFYSRPVTDSGSTSHIVLPPRPRTRTRWLVIGTVVPLTLTLGVLLAFLPLGRYSQHLRWTGFAIGELALVLTFARLIRVTRSGSSAEA